MQPNATTQLEEAATSIPADEEGTVTLTCEPLTPRKWKVRALVDGQAVHVDEINLNSVTSRNKFANAVAGKAPVAVALIDDELLRAANNATTQQPVAHVPESNDAIKESGLKRLDDKAREALDKTDPEIKKAAREALTDPNLVGLILADVQEIGVAGEEELVTALYLVATSRILPDPLASIIQGTSSSGKSYVNDKIASLIPPESLLKATDMTPASLYYGEPGDLMHRHVAAGERSRVQDDDRAECTRALREMLSARELHKRVTVKVGGELVTKDVYQPGPIGFCESTTLINIFDEDANRCLLLSSDETPEQTGLVLDVQAEIAEGKRAAPGPIVAKHHAMQRMLKRVTVHVPFAKAIRKLLPVNRPHARRAFGQILSLVKASAALHQYQRSDKEPQHGDVINANITDYRIARELLRRPLARSLGSGLPDAVERFGHWLKATMGKSQFTAKDIRRDPTAPASNKSTINAYLTRLEESGFVAVAIEPKGPKPATWEIIGETPLSDGQRLLPDPDEIEVSRDE